MNPREELKRFLATFLATFLPNRSWFRPKEVLRVIAVNPKRRKEKAERLSLGIKTGKAYRAFQKAERREVRA